MKGGGGEGRGGAGGGGAGGARRERGREREAEERDEILEERVGPAEQHTPDDDRIENPHVRQALV